MKRETYVEKEKGKARKALWYGMAAVALLFSLAGNAYQYYVYTNHVPQNPYPLINISRNFIAQENFLVSFQPLRDGLQQLVEKEGKDSIAVYFEFLNTGANISINKDLKIWPASLAKLPLALAVMKKIEQGTWKLDNELVLMAGDKNAESGTLFNNPVGSRFAIAQLLEELLVHSDNTAYFILLRNMSASELQPIIDEVGLEELFDSQGKVSAKEYSRLFRALYTSSFLKRENSQKILKWLSRSVIQDYLKTGLPKDIIFSHKFGESREFNVFADSGIVYAEHRPYILSAMIQEKDSEAGKKHAIEVMKEISARVYKYVVKN